jgi:UPF0755 protein
MTNSQKGFLGVIAVLGVATAGGGAWWNAQSEPVAAPNAPAVRVYIPKGMPVQRVANTLQWKHVIKSSLYFTQIARESKIRPGIYELKPSETPAQILKHLSQGDTDISRVTIPEGFTLRQIATRLKEKGVLKDDSAEEAFLTLCTQSGKTLTAPFPLPDNLEGYLFPDTYDFEPNRTPQQIAQTMLDNFSSRIVKNLRDKLPAGVSLDRVLNIAAMVEREAETDKDRPIIAGVIENRLKRDMRLEIDATVQYAQGVHKSRLMFSDLKIESAYNTYKHKGLPPTPICSPGLPSIKAALAPATHDFLFYVAGKDGKAHIFAKTYEEHKQNIVKVRH